MSAVDRTGGPPSPAIPDAGSAKPAGDARPAGDAGFSHALDAQRESARDAAREPGGVFARRSRADVDRFTEVEDAKRLEHARRAGLAPRKRHERSLFGDETDDEEETDG